MVGHSHGILLRVKDEAFKVGSMDHGEFYVSMKLLQRNNNFKWEVIVVYEPTDHSRSSAFLIELATKVEWATLPVVVGGDFNLRRSIANKITLRSISH